MSPKTKETYPNTLIDVEKWKKLQDILWKEEAQKILRDKSELYQKLQDKIHILTTTQADILSLKSELSWTAEEKAEKLLKLLEKKEKKWVVEKIEDKVDEAVDTAKEKAEEAIDTAKKKVLEKTGLWAMWEKVTGMFDKFTGLFDNIWKKITAALAGTSLWAFFGFTAETDEDKEETVENEEDMNTEKIQKQLEKEWKINTTPEVKEGDKEAVKKTVDTKDSAKYRISIKTMLSLSWITIWTEKTKDPILKEIKNITYNTITGLSTEDNKKQFLEGWWKEETLNEIIKQFKSDKFVKIASYSFQPEFIQNIINKNPNIVDKIEWWQKKLDEIIKASKSGGKDWWKDKLTISEISLFYWLSFSLLTIPVWKWISNIKSGLSWLFFEQEETEKLENNNLISNKIIQNFTNNWLINFWWNDLTKPKKDKFTKEKISEEPKKLDKKEKEQLDKLIEFKNYVIWNYLETLKPKIEWEQKELFINNLNYGHVIAIYSIMWWQKDVSKEWVINRFSLNYINSKVLWPYEWSTYLWKIAYEIIFKTDTDIFSDDEIEILSIYKDKFLEMAIWYNLAQIWKKINFLSWATNTDLNKLALWLWIGWTWSYLLWLKIIKWGIEKGKISFIWAAFKKLWIIWMISWIALWGYSFYNKDHIKSDDLKEDIKKAWDDAEKILNILKEYNDSIKEYNIDWKKIEIIKYKNDTPLIIMDNKLYTFDIIDDTDNIKKIIDEFKIDNKESWTSTLSWIKNWVLDWVSSKNWITEINWKRIDTSKFKIDNWYITIWKNNKKYSVSELFTWIDNKTTGMHKDLRRYIQNQAPDRKFFWWDWEEFSFIELDDLWKWKTLSLVEIWKIEPQKNWK